MKLSTYAYAICMVLLTWNTASAQSKPILIEYWAAHNPASVTIVDHSAWDDILQKYTQTTDAGLNLSDYANIATDDKIQLEDYLDLLSSVTVTELNLDEQRAYWTNAYNAITVNLVIDAYPVSSIRKVNSFFGFGPWNDELFEVEGMMLSLNNIEHGILRPIWNDPRIHYSVNCASFGCPNLANRAWTAANMEAMLDEGARNFINSEYGVHKIKGNGVIVSPIYRWFKVDFGSDDASIIAHIRRYADEDLHKELAAVTRIDGHGYDWTLNEIKKD